MSTTTTSALTGTYTIDPVHTRIGFSARHAMVTKVRGSFKEFSGSGYFDADDPTQSQLEVAIKASSIDTGSPDRDGHLRSNDFLAMNEHPEIRFSSTDITRIGESRFKIAGDLTIRGITRPVSLEVEFTGSETDPYGQKRIGLEGRGTINRKDWGVNWNAALESGGVLVSEKVNLEFDISAIRTA